MNTHATQLRQVVIGALNTSELISFLTGAGISAESRIPTFRGPEGYWTVGSRNYQPSEIATHEMLLHKPKEVWKWFLFRRGVCQDALPNPGHFAIAEMEALLSNRLRVITQNVDGLHLRAGNTLERTYQVHGNLNYMRCSRDCSPAAYPIPEDMHKKARGEDLSGAEWDMLMCPACGCMARPNVLLWDEYYDEQHYKFDSSLHAASKTSLLIIVGTTGSTNLPHHVVANVLRRGGTIIDVNIETSMFSKVALRSAGGMFIQGNSSDILPAIADLIKVEIATQSKSGPAS